MCYLLGTGHFKLQQSMLVGALLVDNEELEHSHLVGGKRTSLVGANDRRAAERLDRRQTTHDSVLLGHATSAQCKTGSDNGGKSFRDGGNGECDSNLEVVDSA